MIRKVLPPWVLALGPFPLLDPPHVLASLHVVIHILSLWLVTQMGYGRRYSKFFVYSFLLVYIKWNILLYALFSVKPNPTLQQ